MLCATCSSSPRGDDIPAWKQRIPESFPLAQTPQITLEEQTPLTMVLTRQKEYNQLSQGEQGHFQSSKVLQPFGIWEEAMGFAGVTQ